MSYFQDHGLPDPSRTQRRRRSGGINADISHFMGGEEREYRRSSSPSAAAAPSTESFLAIASLFGSIRDRTALADNSSQVEFLDNLVSQLLEEANAQGKDAPPPASKAFLASLALTEAGDDNATCAVCVDGFTAPSTKLPCDHRFHMDCITPWLSLHNTCPVCRREYPTDDAEYEKKREDKERERLGLPPLEVEAENPWDSMYG
ncbi:hypothetical protein HDU87_008646 [Geranomyces variabilis]|uniref:RING-type domain-containing protein n=1 Tax=Geranomyces variabilis TaxID=109894 RepID=A0AAD5TD21_9FUNG|nr:hypothetical protein HDU87_008646 [Geranomyces variabilis]